MTLLKTQLPHKGEYITRIRKFRRTIAGNMRRTLMRHFSLALRVSCWQLLPSFIFPSVVPSLTVRQAAGVVSWRTLREMTPLLDLGKHLHIIRRIISGAASACPLSSKSGEQLLDSMSLLFLVVSCCCWWLHFHLLLLFVLLLLLLFPPVVMKN